MGSLFFSDSIFIYSAPCSSGAIKISRGEFIPVPDLSPLVLAPVITEVIKGVSGFTRSLSMGLSLRIFGSNRKFGVALG